MSFTADNSYAERMRQLVSRTTASFTINNAAMIKPAAEEASEHLVEALGNMRYFVQTDMNPRTEVLPCCATGCEVPDAVMTITFSPDFSWDSPNWTVPFSWTPVSGATSYDLSSNQPDAVFNLTGPTEATLVTAWTTESQIEVTVTAVNSCGQSEGTTSSIAPCFLAGSQVSMANGSLKAIEDVAVGDVVIGAFGEHNEVLALHRPLLGSTMMCNINREHHTTNHHPHVSVDKKFYCGEPGTVSTHTYGRIHQVINGAGELEERMLYGLSRDRILPLEIGVALKTIDGQREVTMLETYSMPPSTQLYNLVVGGSHTYHVDGYAVTGWPREDDFNYDTWAAV